MTEEKQMTCLTQCSKSNTDFGSCCIAWCHEEKSEKLQKRDIIMPLGQMEKIHIHHVYSL